MKINSLNTVGGKDIPFATLVLNLQVELLFIYGDPCGIITHHNNTVYLETAHNKFFEQIQTMLWERQYEGFPKALYKCINLTKEQEREMLLRMGWMIQAIETQVEIVLGKSESLSSSTVIEKRNECFITKHSFRHAPVIILDYDEPKSYGPNSDIGEDADDPDIDRYFRDEKGDIYRKWSTSQ